MAKRFVYYQPNKKDLKDKVGDCQVRALSKALGLTWVEAFKASMKNADAKVVKK